MSLTPEETRIIKEVGFDPAIVELVRAHTPERIQRLEQMTTSGTEPTSGLSVTVADGEEAESLMKAIGARLKENGYRAFWSKRPTRDTDEVAILRAFLSLVARHALNVVILAGYKERWHGSLFDEGEGIGPWSV